MTKTDPSTCKHPITSVVESRTFEAKGQTFIEQKCRCVDCNAMCETNII